MRKDWKKHGDLPPDGFINKPKLFLGLELYLDAFYHLDTDRTHGFNLTRISWSSIINYARYYGFDEITTDRLVFFIKKMDAAYLKELGKRDGKDS